MKLKSYCISESELQDYLDKYQDKIKWIFPCIWLSNKSIIMIVIDEE